ncbi:hypothetical protein FOZ60_016960 [Perkinsus olseni]|uniref:Uncharacterized protein n=1 Tax=Perkinsus olseni TaxID=32597 RepID=A0A7J6N5C5_PEROL|nr:hypothetical protein FOZ60_016960 [Perkinsus olseni]
MDRSRIIRNDNAGSGNVRVWRKKRRVTSGSCFIRIRGYLEAMLCCRLRQHMRMEHSKRVLRDMELSLPAVRLRPRTYIIDRSRDIELVFRVWVPRNMLESRSESGSQEQSMPYSSTSLSAAGETIDDAKGAIRAFRFWAFGEIDEFEEKLERFTDSWLRSEFGLIGILELIVHRIQELSHLPPRSCSDVSVLAKIVEIELLGWAAKQDWQIAEIQRRKGEEIQGGRENLAASECDESVYHD